MSDSLCGRVFLWILACARGSVLARFWPYWVRQYKASRFCIYWERALGAPMRATERSYIARLAGRIWIGLRRFVAALHLENSLCARMLRALRTSPVLHRSVAGRLFLRLERGNLLLCVFCLYLPIEWTLRNYAPSQVGRLWDHIFLVLCFALAMLWKLDPRVECRSDATPQDGPIMLFIGIGVLLVGVVSPTLSVAIEGWRAVYQYMLWFFVIVRLVRNRQAVYLCYVIFVLMGIGLGLHGVYQYIVGTPSPASWVSVYEVGVRTRAFSIVGSPNILGCLMVMLAPMAAGMAYAVSKTGLKLLCWAGVGVMCLCCVVTFSRGAWVALAVAVVVFALLRDRRLLLLGGLAAVVGMMIPEIMNRIAFLFTSDFVRNNSTAGRGARWEYGIDLVTRSNPVFGFGLGRFGGAVAMRHQTMETVNYFYMDNYYLKIFVEMGYVGLIGYLLLLVAALWNGVRVLFCTRPQSEKYSLACGLFSGLIGVLVHCYFENIFEVPYMSAYFWGLMALLLAIGWRWKDNDAAAVNQGILERSDMR